MNDAFYISKKITRALSEWQFEQACNFHDELLKFTYSNFSEYIKLLADFGMINRIYELIYNCSDIISNNSCKQKYPAVVDYFKEFITDKFIKNRFSPSGGDINSNLLYLSQSDDKSELLSYMKANSSDIFNNKSSAEDNMIVNFAINKLIESNSLTCDIGIQLIHTIVDNPNVNQWRKRFVTSSVLNYFLVMEDKTFFTLKDKFYNHIQKIAYQLSKDINEDGAKITYSAFKDAIVKYNKTQLRYAKNKSSTKKVAICISGMFRGNSLAIDSLKENIINPLGADVFIHSWDTWQSWSGMCGDGPNMWAWRLFGDDAKKICPNLLRSFLDFKKHFPKSADIIETPISLDFTPSLMKSIINPTAFKLDSEATFIEFLGDNSTAFKTRDNHNQAKMFYGIYESTKLMRRHEEQHDFKYDYVIRARPDCAITNKLTSDFLESLKHNELATEMFPDYGPQEQFYVSKRDVHVKIADLWNASQTAERLSPFENFPLYDAHALMFLWMSVNNIVPVSTPVKRDLVLVASNTRPPEELYGAIKYDMENAAKNLVENIEVKKFIDYLLGLIK